MRRLMWIFSEADLKFIVEKLAALIPPPRLNLVRYHGILAPNARDRHQVVPTKRGMEVKRYDHANEERYGGAIEALDEAGRTGSAEALAAARWKHTD